MMLTGAMTIIAAGSSAQLVIALLIVLLNMLAVLKLAPFVDEADDWLSFLTSFQMVMTILGGLLMMMNDPADPDYDSAFMGDLLIGINSIGFFALAVSLSMLHPKVRACVNKTGEDKYPGDGEEEAKADTFKSKKSVPDAQAEMVRDWNPSPPPSDVEGVTCNPQGSGEGETKESPSKDIHGSMMAAALALFESGQLSEESAAKVRVAQEMCRDDEITKQELIHLLRKWTEVGAITEAELAVVLVLYKEDPSTEHFGV